MPTNDNDATTRGATPPSLDPHGHAALLLVESLIHGLCEKSVLSTDEAVEVAERAANVQADKAEAAEGAGAVQWQSHAFLLEILASLQVDGD